MKYIIITLFAFIIYSCNNTPEILNSEIYSSSDTMKQYINDININIEYYTQQNDYKNLAKLYNKKGKIYCQISTDTAIDCYKKAEYYAQNIEDPYLQYMIAWGISAVNGNVGDKDLALIYSKKRYEYSKKLGKKEIASSILALGICYYYLGEKDSAKTLCDRLLLQIDDIPYREHAYFYTLMGELLEETDSISAIHYYEKGVQYFYHPECYKKLAKHYLSARRYEDANKLIQKVMDSCNYEIQIEMLEELCSIEKENNNLENALRYSSRIIELKDSLQNRINNCRVIEAQHEFECKIREIERQKKIKTLQLGIIIIVLTIGLLLLSLRYRKLAIIKKRIDNELEIHRLREQLTESKATGKASQQQIDRLSKLIAEKEKEWESQFHNVKSLAEQINQNHSIIKWTNEDLHSFIDYSISKHNDLQEYLNSNYNSLSDNDKMFLILEYLGKSDDNIQAILGISASGVRMRRSRINKKKY